jgi:hypothetical protein
VSAGDVVYIGGGRFEWGSWACLLPQNVARYSEVRIGPYVLNSISTTEFHFIAYLMRFRRESSPFRDVMNRSRRGVR